MNTQSNTLDPQPLMLGLREDVQNVTQLGQASDQTYIGHTAQTNQQDWEND